MTEIKKLIIFVIAVTSAFYLSMYAGHRFIENKVNKAYMQGYHDSYEIGRLDQLNEDAEEAEKVCFNISKNQELNDLLRKYFKDCKLAKTMWAIAQAESSGKQFAVGQNDNGSLDGGWLQVNTIHKHTWETNKQFVQRMHNLEENIKEARNVYDKQGLKAWSTYNSGKYIIYLK